MGCGYKTDSYFHKYYLGVNAYIVPDLNSNSALLFLVTWMICETMCH